MQFGRQVDQREAPTLGLAKQAAKHTVKLWQTYKTECAVKKAKK